LINPADIPPSLWDPGDPQPAGPPPEGDFFASLSEAEQDALVGRDVAERVRSGEVSSLDASVLRLIETARQEPEL